MALDFSDQAAPVDAGQDSAAQPNFADVIRTAGEKSGPDAVSPKGARGTMQVLDSTNTSPGFGVVPAQDNTPAERERVGRDYANALNTHYSDPTLASIAYNAGPGKLDQWIAKYGDPRSGKISMADFLAKIPYQETKDYAGRIQTAMKGKGGAPDFSAQAKPLDFSAQAAPVAPKPKDIGIAGEFGAGTREGAAAVGKTLNVQGVPQASATTSSLETAAETLFPPLAGAKAFLQGLGLFGTAPPEKPTAGSQPLDFSQPLDVHSVTEKLARGVGQSAPVVAAASLGGIPAAGETAFEQTYGPKLAEEQARNPHDPVGNQAKAVGEATTDAAATALGWKLFELTPFKGEAVKVINDATGEVSTVFKKTIADTIKNIAAQGLAIQPAVSLVNQGINNLIDGRPITEGMPEEYVKGGLMNALMMGMTHLIHPPGLEQSPWRKPAEGEVTPYNPTGLDQGPIIDQGGPGGFRPGGGAAAAQLAGPPPPAGSDIGLRFPDGSIQRATVQGYGANGSTIKVQFDDGSTVEHLTSEVMRDRAPPPPPRFETQPEPPKPYQRQLGPDEGAAPPFGEAPPEAPGKRAAAKIAARQPQPVLDPQAIHALDLADRLEGAATDPGNPMSTNDRMAALMQVARIRQQFQSQGEESVPGAYKHPGAGQERIGQLPVQPEPASYEHPGAAEPARDLGALAAARAANPALYETIGESGSVSRSAGDQDGQEIQGDVGQRAGVQPLPEPTGDDRAVLPPVSGGIHEGVATSSDQQAAAHDAAAALTDTNPTPAQAAAGNYKHGKLTVQGIPVSVETPKGALREGIGANGEPWQNRNELAHYGYITAQGQVGTDGDHIDAYVGPHPNSPVAFVVDQVDPKTGAYDEHKAILGARNESEARDIYNAGFSDGSGPSRIGAITKMPIFPFKEWLKNGDLQRPLNAMADPDYQSALWDVRDARSKAKTDKDILGTIVAMGGIKIDNARGETTPEGQTIRQIVQDYRRPGLINNRSGMTPDYVREALTEQGWFGDRDAGQSDVRQLYDMLDTAVRGGKVFHPESDANSILERRALTDEEMGRAGVLSTDSHADAAKKLLDFRRQGIEEMAAHYEDAADEEVEKLSPGAIELLTQYGYEPGADHGAEHEVESQPEESQRATETQREAEPSHEGQEHGGAGTVEPEGGGEAAPQEPAEGFRTTPGAIAAEHEAEVSHLEAAGTKASGEKHARLPEESVDLGRGVEGKQAVIPGAEQSAKQLALAREAQGHGRVKANAEQKEPGGLFAEPSSQKGLFQFDQPGHEGEPGKPDDISESMERWFSDKGVGSTPGDISRGIRDFLLARGRETGTEAIALYDAKENNVPHVVTENIAGSSAFSSAMIDAMADPASAIIGHHNHPLGLSLSVSDIGALSYPGLKWIVAHGDDGKWFAASLTPYTRALQERVSPSAVLQRLTNAHAQAEQRALQRFSDAVRAGKIPAEEATDELPHVINSALSHLGLINYISSKEVSKNVEQIVEAVGRSFLTKTPYRHAEPIQYAEGIGKILAEHAPAPTGRGGEGRDNEGRGLPAAPEGGENLPKGLKQPTKAQAAKPFFSALTRSVEAIKQEKAPAKQWEGIIDNLKTKGVKQDEIDWSGVKDWLRDQTGPVTKDQVLQHLRENEVQVQEVEKGARKVVDHEAVARQVRLEDAEDALTSHLVAQGFHQNDARDFALDAAKDHLSDAQMRNVSDDPHELKLVNEIRDAYSARRDGDYEAAHAIQPTEAKYGSYTLPGGKDYRELLLTLPPKDNVTREPSAAPDGWGDTEGGNQGFVERGNNRQDYRSGHWDEPNVLAHVRFDDRTGPNGEKVLHVAEIQSDWHQAGRRRGYGMGKPKVIPSIKGEDLRVEERGEHQWLVIAPDGRNFAVGKGVVDGEAGAREYGERYLNNEAHRENLEADRAASGKVPNAPFKSSWYELAMKRVLRYAAEHGYDRLSWDTGDTAADRFDLSKQIRNIVLDDNNSGGIGRPSMRGPFSGGMLKAYDHSGKEVISQYVHDPKQLPDLIGKEAADKIVAANPTEARSAGLGVRRRELSGLDLKVGGDGMKGFYDKILPDFVRKYTKKWGAKVQDTTIAKARTKESVAESVYGHGQRYADLPDISKETVDQIVRRDAAPVHSVDITPEMRDSVMAGQPLFQRTLPTIWADIGGTKRLAPDFYARMPRIPSEGEAQLIEQINRIVKQIAPGALVIPAKDLTYRGKKIWGAMYVDGPRNVIAWAMEGPSPVNAVHHEAVHWLRNVGFFRPDEWETLSNAAINDNWLNKHDIHGRYPDSDFAEKVEEAIAEEYASWAERESTPPPPVRTIFGRLRELFNRVRKYLRSLYGDTVKADDIFSKIMSGEIGSREPLDKWKPSEEVFAQASKTPEGPPETPAEGRDYIDATTNDLAEHMREKGPGTYERTLKNMAPPSGPELFARANWAQREFVGPRTVAEIDTKSGRLWSALQREEDEASTRLHDLRDNIRDNFLKLPRENQDRVNGVMELDRLENRTRTDDGRSILARNTNFPDARGSKPGDALILTPEETKAYFGLQRMYREAWDNIMEGSARRMGWTRPWSPAMADNFKEIERAMTTADGQRNRKAFQRIHDVLSAMEEQRRAAYMPLMRFGDYYFSVTPKYDKESTGGFPESVWFSLAERPSFQYADVDPAKMLRFETTQTGQVPDYAKGDLTALQAKYPGKDFRINHGYLLSKPDMLRQMSIPAIEKLMMLLESGVMDRMKAEASMEGFANKGAAYKKAKEDWQNLYEELVDAVRDEMYEQLKAGFKKRSRTVPGYSKDWNRALGTYMGWTSRHVARQIHGDAIERIYEDIQTNHPHASIRDYWRDWKQDDDSPMTPLSRIGIAANQLGFMWTMAMNPASTVSIAMHGPTYAIPTLGTGIGVPKAAAAFTKAYGEATTAIRWDDKHGAVIDTMKVGKTPDERAFLKSMEASGYLHAKGAEDIRSMAEKASAIWGDYTPHAQQAMDILSSNIAVADQANRVAASLAAYRLARDGNLGHMNATWAGNQVWRAISQEEGVSPESMGKFLLNQSVGEWGGRSRSKFGRSFIGRMGSSLHGFQIRFLSNWLKQLFRQGGAGRIAAAWSMAALWAAAGLQGLPFVQDAENGIDAIWKKLLHHDPMLAWRLRAMLVDTGLGKTGADIVMRGPLSTATGIDFASRLGFGDVITRDIAPWFGAANEMALTFPSIVAGAIRAVTSREGSHQPAAAAASLLPAALRHPAQAVIDAEHGVKSQSGKTMYVPARKFTGADEAKEAAGFTPLDVAHAREHAEFRYRAKNAHGKRPPDTVPR